MRRIMLATLLVLVPWFANAASTPVVNSGTINYLTNQITLTGSGFQPAKAKPTVLFDGAGLTLSTFSNTQIVATLPAATPAGSFSLTVTNSAGNSAVFDMTYGATGLQGPAGPAGAQGPIGPAGATGPQGPRGITGAPGAPGPAGANGIGFTFLNAFDPYATYTLNDVVTYAGSSYIAIVANGPNPTGPTPDKNPSWSLLAAAGTAGAAGPAGALGLQGPAGEQGLTGPMGNPGPVGPSGPAGPQGSTGGVLSFVVSTQQGVVNLESVHPASVNSLVLPNVGTYVIGGQQTIVNGDPTNPSQAQCFLYDGTSQRPGLLVNNFTVGADFTAVIPLAGYYVAQSAPITLVEECQSSNALAQQGVLTAIQVQ
jgi:hypothetical protein